jgi:hypothetical protein
MNGLFFPVKLRIDLYKWTAGIISQEKRPEVEVFGNRDEEYLCALKGEVIDKWRKVHNEIYGLYI